MNDISLHLLTPSRAALLRPAFCEPMQFRGWRPSGSPFHFSLSSAISLPKFFRDIAPSRIVTVLVVFSRIRGVLAPPHNRRRVRHELLATVGLRDTLRSMADLTEMGDGLS